MMCLADCKKNKLYKIIRVENQDPQVLNMLKNLLIVPDEIIMVTSSNYGRKSILVNISNISYGIDIMIAKNIFVEEINHE